MKRLKLVLPLAFVSMLTLAGCAGPRYYGYGYQVPPPPAPRYGAIGYAPGPGYIWCDGFWDLRGSRWVWSQGYWARPPRHHATWVAGYWAPRGRGYAFRRGHWR